MQITCNGITLSSAEWSKRTGIPNQTITGRILRGWKPKEALLVKPELCFKRADSGEKITKNDAEMMLNDGGWEGLPEVLKPFARTHRGTRVGSYLRDNFRKQFDLWFEGAYKPEMIKKK